MKLLVKLILITSSLFLASLIMAHEGHKHAEQLDQTSAIEAASIKIAELIQAMAQHFIRGYRPAMKTQAPLCGSRLLWQC